MILRFTVKRCRVRDPPSDSENAAVVTVHPAVKTAAAVSVLCIVSVLLVTEMSAVSDEWVFGEDVVPLMRLIVVSDDVSRLL